MKCTVELKGLLRTAQAEFRTLNRNRNLSAADKKLLKTFYLNNILAPRAKKLLGFLYPASHLLLEPGGGDRMAGERLLTARELEAKLKIDTKTIYKYAQRNLIPNVKIGTSVRFPEKDVRAWLERHSYTPPSMRKRKRRRAKPTRKRKH